MTGITVDAVELRRIVLPLVAPFGSSAGTSFERDVLMVRVFATGANGDVEGWAECVATSTPNYTAEYTDGAHAVIRDHLVPALLAAEVTGADDVAAALSGIVEHRMAKAALETAVLDAELRADGTSFAQRLGAVDDRVPVGVAVGIQGDLDALVATAAGHAEEGYRRIKVKIGPGWDREPVARLRAELGDDFALQVDANAAYAPGDPSSTDALRALDDFGLLLIEQPYAPDRLVDHAQLAATLTTPVCLDESIISDAVTADVIALGAAGVINVKPGRVGGYLEALAIHDRCVAAGVPMWVGGMLETGVGRAANLALAALPGFTLPGDISAADRYWHRDIVTTSAVLDSDGTVAVPDEPGIGVDVDVEFLESVTTSIEHHDAH